MSTLDAGTVLRTLLGANVQFVVVGEPGDAGGMRLVVSRHPTNLDMLGRALDRLGASLRGEASPVGGRGTGPQRVGDPLGTVSVSTDAGELDLLFGGAHRSLYADTLDAATERSIDGVDVPWATGPALSPGAPRPTGAALGGRLLSIAGRLAHLVERRGEGEADGDGSADVDGDAPERRSDRRRAPESAPTSTEERPGSGPRP